MVNDAYKACPAESIFPHAYGLNGNAVSWDVSSSIAETLTLDLSYDGRYVVAGGYIDWNGSQFLPETDYEVVQCDGAACDEQLDNGTISNVYWQRGFI